MKTYLIGAASNLSQRMHTQIDDTHLLSVREILSSVDFKFADSEPFNLVINAFWPATKLRDVSEPEKFVNVSLTSTAKILYALKDSNVNKLFYTSSASVYGDNKNCSEQDDPKPKSLHAALKLANEQLVKTFCEQNSIAFTIARVFNLYGGEDEFSILSKIIACQKSGQTLTVVNEGSSVRDFIHIDDVVKAYAALLKNQTNEAIINIASGKGRSVLSMLVHMRKNGFQLETENIQRDEISLSVADVSILNKYFDTSSMRDPRDYIVDILESD